MFNRGLLVKVGLICFALFFMLGTSCPVPSIGVDCSPNLDASEFGFMLTAPTGYDCYNVFPNATLLVSVRYRQTSTQFVCSVIVSPPGSGEPIEEEGVTLEDIGSRTNGTGVIFERIKAQVAALNVTSYIGTHTLPSGNVLSITLVGFSDDPALLTALNAVIDSTVIVGG